MSTASRNEAIKSLLEWAEETGRPLPTTPERIVELEEQGYVVDLETGVVTCPERGQANLGATEPKALAIRDERSIGLAVTVDARQWLAQLEKNGPVRIHWRVHPDEWFALHPPTAEPKEEAQG